MPLKHFSSTVTTTDSSHMTMDVTAPDLCTFDSSLTTFDATGKTFDETTCHAVAPPVATGGGDSRRRRLSVRRRVRRYSDEEDVSVQEIINAVAAEQVARPTHEPERRAQLASALLSYKSISVQEKHLVALESERERLIGAAVKQYLEELQEQESSVLMLALAEAL